MKRRVGLLTFSDGRDYVSKELVEINARFE
jgi:L-fucose isomerase